MRHQPLWYVRRDGKLLGPHPRQVVIDCLLLGRFAWDDPASRDGRAWQPLKLHPEILSALEPVARDLRAEPGEPVPVSWHGERLAAARRWADERTGIERRTVQDPPAEGERRRVDERRRQRELLQVVIWRRLREELAGAYDRSGVAHWWGWPVAALAAAALATAVWQREPILIDVSPGVGVVDCNAPAAAEVRWSGCDRTGAWLAGADLRGARLAGTRLAGSDLQRARLNYADLAGATLAGARLDQAQLFGASLTGADLGGASLVQADLSFADLRNARLAEARFDRARLDNALWATAGAALRARSAAATEPASPSARSPSPVR